jgi:hypothetical protein
VKVISALLSGAPEKARAMLGEVDLRVPASPCASATTYNLRGFYQLVRQVIATTYTPGQLARGDHAELLEREIGRVNSPVQLAPLAELLAEVKLRAQQRQDLMFKFANVLRNSQATDRELSAIFQDLGSGVGLLASSAAKSGIQPQDVVQAYREFLVTSAASVQCGDRSTPRRRVAESFNNMVKELKLEDSIRMLEVAELAATRRGESAAVEQLPDLPVEFRGLLRRLNTIRDATVYAELRKGQTADLYLQYEADADDFLKKIELLDDAGDQCTACRYHEKMELYYYVLNMAPTRGTQGRIGQAIVHYLATTRMQEEGPLEWLYHFKLLLNMARVPTREQMTQIAAWDKGIQAAAPLPLTAGPEIRESMKKSSDTIMNTYVMAEEVLRPKYVLPLFPPRK